MNGCMPSVATMPGNPAGRWLDVVGWLRSFLPAMSHVEVLPAKVGTEARTARAHAEGAARFQDVILPHLDAAHNLARYLSGDATAAEDIVQEAYLRAFRAFGDFRGGSSKAWILTIVRNCHLNWRADQRRRSNIEPLESMSHTDDPAFEDADISERADLPRDETTPESILAQRMEADEVRLVLAGLPEAFREALVLRELECLSYREISDVTSIPIGTVMSRLARARALFAIAWRQRLAAGKKPR
jgi:RNA polymerase sigma factor (sigma-70 family)